MKRIVLSCNGGVKKYFLFSTNMAENNRFSKNFFSKCVAASGARNGLDVEARRVSYRFKLVYFDEKSIK